MSLMRRIPHSGDCGCVCLNRCFCESEAVGRRNPVAEFLGLTSSWSTHQRPLLELLLVLTFDQDRMLGRRRSRRPSHFASKFFATATALLR